MWGCKRPRLLQRILQTAAEYFYFLFFFSRNSSYSSPPPNTHPWSKQAPGFSHSPAWLSPKNLAADPAAPAGDFSCPGPSIGPRDLIVLKQSSYHLIFQCPLQFLVSDLHICWNTIGCSLCSSDQLGVSLVPRGSGLRSHLSRRHLRLLRSYYIFK